MGCLSEFRGWVEDLLQDIGASLQIVVRPRVPLFSQWLTPPYLKFRVQGQFRYRSGFSFWILCFVITGSYPYTSG